MDPITGGDRNGSEVEENVINILVIRQDDNHTECDTSNGNTTPNDTEASSPTQAVPFIGNDGGMIRHPEILSPEVKGTAMQGSPSNVALFSAVPSPHESHSRRSFNKRPPLFKSQSFTIMDDRLAEKQDLSTATGKSCPSSASLTPAHRKVVHKTDVLDSMTGVATPVRLKVVRTASPVPARKLSKRNSINLPIGSPCQPKHFISQPSTCVSALTALSPLTMSNELKQSSIQNLICTPDSGFFTPRMDATSSQSVLPASPLSTPKTTHSSSIQTAKRFMTPAVLSSGNIGFGNDSAVQDIESPLMFSQQSALVNHPSWTSDFSQICTSSLVISSSVEQPVNNSIPFIEHSNDIDSIGLSHPAEIQAAARVDPPPLVMRDWTFSPIAPLPSSITSTLPMLQLAPGHSFQTAERRKALEELELNQLQPSASTPLRNPQLDRPNFSYMDLIKMALKDSEDGQMTLKEILSWIESRFPFFKHDAKASWKSSIRHNLSLHRDFIKVEERKHGGKWKLREGARQFIHKLPKPPVVKFKVKSPKKMIKTSYKPGQQPILPKSMPYALVPLPLSSLNQQGQQQMQNSPIPQQQRFPIILPPAQPMPLPLSCIPLQQMPSQPQQFDTQGGFQQVVSQQALQNYQQSISQQNNYNTQSILNGHPVQNGLSHEHPGASQKAILPKFSSTEDYQQSREQVGQMLSSSSGSSAMLLPSSSSCVNSKILIPSPSTSREEPHHQNISVSDPSKLALSVEQQDPKIFSASGQLKPVSVEVYEDEKTKGKKIVFYMKHPQEMKRNNDKEPQDTNRAINNSVLEESVGSAAVRNDSPLLNPKKQSNICKVLDKMHRSKSFDTSNRLQHLKLSGTNTLKTRSQTPEINFESSLAKDTDTNFELSHLFSTSNQLPVPEPSKSISNSLIEEAWTQANVKDKWGESDSESSINLQENPNNVNKNAAFEMSSPSNTSWNLPLNVESITVPSTVLSGCVCHLDCISNIRAENSLSLVQYNPKPAVNADKSSAEFGTGSQSNQSNHNVSLGNNDLMIKEIAAPSQNHCIIADQSWQQQKEIDSTSSNSSSLGQNLSHNYINTQGGKSRYDSLVVRVGNQSSLYRASSASKIVFPRSSSCEKGQFSSRSVATANSAARRPSTPLSHILSSDKDSSLSPHRHLKTKSQSGKSRRKQIHTPLTSETSPGRDKKDSVSHDFLNDKSFERLYQESNSNDHSHTYKNTETPVAKAIETNVIHCSPDCFINKSDITTSSYKSNETRTVRVFPVPVRDNALSATETRRNVSISDQCTKYPEENQNVSHSSWYRMPMPADQTTSNPNTSLCTDHPQETQQKSPSAWLHMPMPTKQATTSLNACISEQGIDHLEESDNQQVSPSTWYRMPMVHVTTSPNTSLILTPSSQSLSHFLSLTSTPPVAGQALSTSPQLEVDQLLPQGILHDQSNSSSFLDSSLFDNLDSLFEAKTP